MGQVTCAGSARSSASLRRRRDGSFQESDHAVDEVAERDRERQQQLAGRAGPLAVGGGVHDQHVRLRDPVGAQRLGDVAQEHRQTVGGTS